MEATQVEINVDIEESRPVRLESDVGDKEPAKDVRQPWYRALPYFVEGDLDAFLGVFFNNLATMLVGVGLLVPKIGEYRAYNYVVPAIAVSMAFGGVYYVVQAQLKSASTGRSDLCAQPFGINTPGVFAFVFGVIYPVYAGAVDTQGHEAAAELAWSVGVLANLIQGVIEIALSLIGPSIAEAVPMVALLGSLASIGLTFLCTESFQGEAYAPLVGFVPFYLIMMAMCAKVKLPKVPALVIPVAVGTIMAWVIRQPGVVSVSEVQENIRFLGWHPCRVNLEVFSKMSEVASKISVVFPVALTVSVGTIQCRQLSAKAGDDYNLRASMLGDGFATVVAALFGSPFGMTVFIGHPGFKKMGAKIGYNLICAVCFILVCFSGMAGLLAAVVPTEALNPILMFIGLAICCDALDVTPQCHWPALMLSLIPCFCNWAVTQAQNFAAFICNQPGSTCVVNPSSIGAWTLDNSGSLRGLYALGQGYLLTSIYLTSMLIFVIDRSFGRAAGWALVAAISAAIGLIHSDTLFLPWVGSAAPDSSATYNPDQLDLHWQFVAAYMGLCALFEFCHALQRLGFIEQDTRHQIADKLVGEDESVDSLPETRRGTSLDDSTARLD